MVDHLQNTCHTNLPGNLILSMHSSAMPTCNGKSKKVPRWFHDEDSFSFADHQTINNLGGIYAVHVRYPETLIWKSRVLYMMICALWSASWQVRRPAAHIHALTQTLTWRSTVTAVRCCWVLTLEPSMKAHGLNISIRFLT